MMNKISIALIVLVGSALTQPLNAQSSFKFQTRAAHAPARETVGIPPLYWDPAVAEYARYRAGQLAANCRPEPSSGPYGENIAVGNYHELCTSDFVRIWVGKKVNYDYNSNSCAPGKYFGHYTQVVWRDSRALGCEMIACDDVRALLVCNYSPRGKINGKKPY